MTFSLVIPEFSTPFDALWWLFAHGGFLAVLVALGYGVFWLYMDTIQTRYAMKQKYMLLAVDVPKENEQTPQAVEHLFSHFHGIQKNPNRREKYIDGYVQPTITVEMISIGGYIQYIVRCPIENRDLVEAAIYAQYPNAEISEVEDYAADWKAEFPNDNYDLWGAELTLVNKSPLPIKTYPLWEHQLTQTFLDPMASLLEVMGRLREGEQIWLQYVLAPTGDNHWRQQGIEMINKLIGVKSKHKASGLDFIASAPGAILQGTYETVTRTLIEPGESGPAHKKDDPPSMLAHTPPHVRNVVEAIGNKISKLGFETKFRFVYIGEKEVFDRSRVAGVFGALKQYASLDMNGFRPDKKMKTSRTYFRVQPRVNEIKKKILRAYKGRSNWSGRAKFILNTEELASLWHFPVITVKAPTVKKSDAKRGEPPTSLPVGAEEELEYVPKARPAPEAETPSGPQAPSNLPIG